jgi:hypothetical protein
MDTNKSDLLQATLDMLILKVKSPFVRRSAALFVQLRVGLRAVGGDFSHIAMACTTPSI